MKYERSIAGLMKSEVTTKNTKDTNGILSEGNETLPAMSRPPKPRGGDDQSERTLRASSLG